MQNKTYREALREGQRRLSALTDGAFDARCLLEFCTGSDRTGLVLRYAEPIPTDVRNRYEGMLSRRLDGEPLQYILGEWDFFGRTFFVREGVLIPRPETEFLVEKAVSLLPHNAVVFDVCAGTGCIGISVALERPDTKVYLLEKYDAPFRCLTDNIQKHHVENVEAVQCDLFDGVPKSLPMPDGILSNPPYIRTGDLSALQAEVQREPMQALDGGEDGLLFYRALADKWVPSLHENGFISMECGEAQPSEIVGLFHGRAEIEKDFVGVERFVTIYTK